MHGFAHMQLPGSHSHSSAWLSMLLLGSLTLLVQASREQLPRLLCHL